MQHYSSLLSKNLPCNCFKICLKEINVSLSKFSFRKHFIHVCCSFKTIYPFNNTFFSPCNCFALFNKFFPALFFLYFITGLLFKKRRDAKFKKMGAYHCLSDACLTWFILWIPAVRILKLASLMYLSECAKIVLRIFLSLILMK